MNSKTEILELFDNEFFRYALCSLLTSFKEGDNSRIIYDYLGIKDELQIEEDIRIVVKGLNLIDRTLTSLNDEF